VAWDPVMQSIQESHVGLDVLTDIVVFNTTSILLTDVMINVSWVNVDSIPDDKCLLEPTMNILFVLVQRTSDW